MWLAVVLCDALTMTCLVNESCSAKKKVWQTLCTYHLRWTRWRWTPWGETSDKQMSSNHEKGLTWARFWAAFIYHTIITVKSYQDSESRLIAFVFPPLCCYEITCHELLFDVLCSENACFTIALNIYVVVTFLVVQTMINVLTTFVACANIALLIKWTFIVLL